MDTHKLRVALAGVLCGQSGKITNAEDYLHSAVTVPLIDMDGKPAILFEVRSSKLQWQPGEICFPGGRIESYDSSPLQAALRETVEELGVSQEDIEVLGEMDYLVSPLGVIMYPYAVHISAQLPFTPNEDEVADVFTVPLDFLLTMKPQIASMEVATKPLEGFPYELLPADYPKGYQRRAEYQVLFYQYNQYVIWGLTARILTSFLDICRNRLAGGFGV